MIDIQRINVEKSPIVLYISDTQGSHVSQATTVVERGNVLPVWIIDVER